jgi:hypothetical protein
MTTAQIKANRARAREWNRKHRELVRDRVKVWRKENIKSIAQHNKTYREKHIIQIRRQHRNYNYVRYHNDPEFRARIKAANKRWASRQEPRKKA